MGEGKQAVAEGNLPLQLAPDERKGIEPLGVRVGGFDQAADGRLVVDIAADRLAVGRASLCEPAGTLEDEASD